MSTRPDISKENIIETYDTLRDNKYKVVFSQNPRMSYFINSFIHPECSNPHIDMHYGNTIVRQQGNTIEFPPLTITYLASKDIKLFAYLTRWLRNPSNSELDERDRPDGNLTMGEYKQDISVHILDNNMKDSLVIVYRNAFPIYLSEIAFSNQSNVPMPITQTATFVYDRWDFE